MKLFPPVLQSSKVHSPVESPVVFVTGHKIIETKSVTINRTLCANIMTLLYYAVIDDYCM